MIIIDMGMKVMSGREEERLAVIEQKSVHGFSRSSHLIDSYILCHLINVYSGLSWESILICSVININQFD